MLSNPAQNVKSSTVANSVDISLYFRPVDVAGDDSTITIATTSSAGGDPSSLMLQFTSAANTTSVYAYTSSGAWELLTSTSTSVGGSVWHSLYAAVEFAGDRCSPWSVQFDGGTAHSVVPFHGCDASTAAPEVAGLIFAPQGTDAEQSSRLGWYFDDVMMASWRYQKASDVLSHWNATFEQEHKIEGVLSKQPPLCFFRSNVESMMFLGFLPCGGTGTHIVNVENLMFVTLPTVDLTILPGGNADMVSFEHDELTWTPMDPNRHTTVHSYPNG